MKGKDPEQEDSIANGSDLAEIDVRTESNVAMENLEKKAYRVIQESGEDGLSQAKLWKILGVTSREGSRLAISLERKNKVRRVRVLEDDRWTYSLIAKKSPRSISDMLEIAIPQDLAIPQSQKELSRGDLTRVYRWGTRARISRFTLGRELVELGQIVSKLHLAEKSKEVADEAHDIFKRAVVAEISRGRSVETLTAAVIYAACRRLSIPISLYEICQCSNARKKSVARCYRKMLAKDIFDVPLLSHSIYLERLRRKLNSAGLTEEIWTEALLLVKKAQSRGILRGKNPLSIAAAAVYVAGNGRLTQSEIAEALGITEVTIRNNYPIFESLM